MEMIEYNTHIRVSKKHLNWAENALASVSRIICRDLNIVAVEFSVGGEGGIFVAYPANTERHVYVALRTMVETLLKGLC